MYYGNPGIAQDQSDSTNVWDTNYCAVYHFNEKSGIEIYDSSIYSNYTTIQNSGINLDTNGQIDGGVFFSGEDNNQYIKMFL